VITIAALDHLIGRFAGSPTRTANVFSLLLTKWVVDRQPTRDDLAILQILRHKHRALRFERSGHDQGVVKTKSMPARKIDSIVMCLLCDRNALAADGAQRSDGFDHLLPGTTQFPVCRICELVEYLDADASTSGKPGTCDRRSDRIVRDGINEYIRVEKQLIVHSRLRD
jgi:hypothetical protein